LECFLEVLFGFSRYAVEISKERESLDPQISEVVLASADSPAQCG